MAEGTIYQRPRVTAKPNEAVITSTCGHNCGGRCVVNAHVVDGRIVRISTDPRKWEPELPPLHACARGVGQIEQVYHPERLKYPLRRSGPRGGGEFERISWDEALDEVSRQMHRVRSQYGNAAILDASRSGSLSVLHGRAAAQRFLHMFGGCTVLWSNMSAEAEVFAVRMTYGAEAAYKSAGREPTDYVNSKLIVMWGWSPGDGTFGTGTYEYLKRAKKHGVRIICVDPRKTRSSAVLADEHVFIQPSTDTAALIAMAYVIASEGLQDQAYCDTHVLGFDEEHLPPCTPAGASYRSYTDGDVASGLLGYVIGFVLALGLTACSFYVAGSDLIWKPGIPTGLIVLAVAQMGVHLVFFLHITTSPDSTNNVLALAFGVLIVVLVIGGSLWIMAHLDHNMMPMDKLMEYSARSSRGDGSVRRRYRLGAFFS